MDKYLTKIDFSRLDIGIAVSHFEKLLEIA
jgi:hypothetical protein